MLRQTVRLLLKQEQETVMYVDETADISMAADIIENAKTQRMGVCNACESLVIRRYVGKGNNAYR